MLSCRFFVFHQDTCFYSLKKIIAALLSLVFGARLLSFGKSTDLIVIYKRILEYHLSFVGIFITFELLFCIFLMSLYWKVTFLFHWVLYLIHNVLYM